MKIQVNIPTALRQYTENKGILQLSGSTVEEVLNHLTTDFPMLKKHLFSEDGELRNFVNVYVNDEDIRYMQKQSTQLKDGDSLTIVPSVAGGNNVLTSDIGTELTAHEIQRYSRHIIMPEVALEGQKKLKEASVLIVGVGGLGSPVAMYLAAAGIGRLGLVDADVVDYTNLQRQIIYATGQVGKSKLQSAQARIKAINPLIDVDPYETYLKSENAMEIVQSYDIVLDGTDNFATRYLVNDVCVLTKKPNVYGSIFRFDGQASVFNYGDGPCYRCLYPQPPPPGLVPSCAEGGVLGVLPGIIGVIQATEAIKIILGKGDLLAGRLLLFDAMSMKFREMKVRKDPDCPICSAHPTITALIDYEEFCGLNSAGQIALAPEFEIQPKQLKTRLDTGAEIRLIDVRQPQEYAICRLPNPNLIPLHVLEQRIHELKRSDEIVVYCRSGIRSAQAVKFLQEAGFLDVKNLTGGILAWADEVDPTLTKY